MFTTNSCVPVTTRIRNVCATDLLFSPSNHHVRLPSPYRPRCAGKNTKRYESTRRAPETTARINNVITVGNQVEYDVTFNQNRNFKSFSR